MFDTLGGLAGRASYSLSQRERERRSASWALQVALLATLSLPGRGEGATAGGDVAVAARPARAPACERAAISMNRGPLRLPAEALVRAFGDVCSALGGKVLAFGRSVPGVSEGGSALLDGAAHQRERDSEGNRETVDHGIGRKRCGDIRGKMKTCFRRRSMSRGPSLLCCGLSCHCILARCNERRRASHVNKTFRLGSP